MLAGVVGVRRWLAALVGMPKVWPMLQAANRISRHHRQRQSWPADFVQPPNKAIGDHYCLGGL